MKSSSTFLRLALLALLFSAQNTQAAVALDTPIANDNASLTPDEITGIIRRAISGLKTGHASGIICVTDAEGHILAQYRMLKSGGDDFRISEQAVVKARTAAFFASRNDAFTTRTAQFIIQSHFPPTVTNLEGGPLFGVPFSNFTKSDVQLQQPTGLVFLSPNAPQQVPPGLVNFRPNSQPLVITPLTDDPGGVPLFKKVAGKWAPVGAVGVEADGFGVLADGVPDAGLKFAEPGAASLSSVEEQAALAAQEGFAPPKQIRADRVLVNGFRFPYVATKRPVVPDIASQINLAIEGNFEPFFDTDGSERDPDGLGVGADPVVPYGTYNPFAVVVTAAEQPRATPKQEFPRQGWVPRFPPRAAPDGFLSEAEVRRIIQQAAEQARITRGAIRRPIGVSAAVFISVTDTKGNICGVFRTDNATLFSFDVAVQKARTAAFFSNFQVAFSTRALGFMSQTLYPPGLDSKPTGPLSGLLPQTGGVRADPAHLGPFPPPLDSGSGNLTEISQLLNDDFIPVMGTDSEAVQVLAIRIPHIRDGRLSPLQVALTIDLTLGRPFDFDDPDDKDPPTTCTIPNGITLFPGGLPLYRDGVLVGAIGISGDGVDQDDVIAFAGAKGFEPGEHVRCDNAPDDNIVEALNAAIRKAKLQFPNLTNNALGVLDVVNGRISNTPDEVLQRLRLPWVKFPRSLKK
jgi:uncharacterized protein GlcG (DUF336 family)